MSRRELGVIIARFQAPSLTEAHRYLLRQVSTRVNRVLVLLGVAPVPFLRKNPLEYSIRARMVMEWCERELPDQEVLIVPLFDCPSNKEWMERIDQAIAAVNVNGTAVVFSGPDGAGPEYEATGGKWPVEVLDSMGGHASKLRHELIPRQSEDFRAGVIYAVERSFVRPFAVVDVVIKDSSNGSENILLGRKKIDGDKWRLIGGFVDPTDSSLERAVKREVLEETGLEVSEPMYVGSALIDDWRYQHGPESVISSLFYCQRLFGAAQARDDIDEVRWFEKTEVEKVLHSVHQPLWQLTKGVQ